MSARARRRAALLGALAALLAVVPAGPARADGDPASDILLAQDLFLPYPPNGVSAPVARALQTTLGRARARGFPVKVALVADARDLGSAGQLFAAPQDYADLLTQELTVNVVHGRELELPRVLVVLPSGLGGNNLGDTAGTALEGLFPPEAEGPDGLARTAARAVSRLAAAAGHPFALPPLPAAVAAGSGGGGGGGLPSGVLFGAPVLLVLLVVGALTLRRAEPEPGDP